MKSKNFEFHAFSPSGSVLGELDSCVYAEFAKGFSKKRKTQKRKLAKKRKHNWNVCKFQKVQIPEIRVSLTNLSVVFLLLIVVRNSFKMYSGFTDFPSNSPLWPQNVQSASVSLGTRGLSSKVQSQINNFSIERLEAWKSKSDSKTVESVSAPNFLGDLAKTESESQSRLLVGVGGNFDVQMNFQNRHSTTGFQEKLHQLEEKMIAFQANAKNLSEAVQKLQHQEGHTSDLLSIQNSHINIAKQFLNFLKQNFPSQMAVYNGAAFGWTTESALRDHPEYSGLSIINRERQQHRLTRQELKNIFFDGNDRAYQKFQGTLDSYRNLDAAIFKLDSQHLSILEAKDNLQNTFHELKQSVSSIASQFSEIPPNQTLKAGDEFVTIKAPKTLSIQGYKEFGKIDLAASFSLDSKVSVGLGKCKLFPKCGLDNTGVLVGFDVGGSYNFSSKKFGPQAKIFVGFGTCF